uniref:Uncharacterized protein n=1 Tax=Panagrolaimus sp. JU765 TaxID=591449 RepID=A0AC34RRL4_9BILA
MESQRKVSEELNALRLEYVKLEKSIKVEEEHPTNDSSSSTEKEFYAIADGDHIGISCNKFEAEMLMKLSISKVKYQVFDSYEKAMNYIIAYEESPESPMAKDRPLYVTNDGYNSSIFLNWEDIRTWFKTTAYPSYRRVMTKKEGEKWIRFTRDLKLSKMIFS